MQRQFVWNYGNMYRPIACIFIIFWNIRTQLEHSDHSDIKTQLELTKKNKNGQTRTSNTCPIIKKICIKNSGITSVLSVSKRGQNYALSDITDSYWYLLLSKYETRNIFNQVCFMFKLTSTKLQNQWWHAALLYDLYSTPVSRVQNTSNNRRTGKAYSVNRGIVS